MYISLHILVVVKKKQNGMEHFAKVNEQQNTKIEINVV